MISFINKNLLDIEVDVIIQSNNCFNTQGAGLAKAIRAKYPEVYELDCQTLKGDPNKLGKILPVQLKHNQKPYYCFLNYNQYKYGREKRQVDYEAFYNSLVSTKNKCLELGYSTIGIPYGMSCNNAGGCWKIIQSMIEEVFGDNKINIYICQYD